MSFRESEQDAEYHGVGKDDRPAPVHLDLTPGAEVTRACGSPEGASSAFAFADDVTCEACRDALTDLTTARVDNLVAHYLSDDAGNPKTIPWAGTFISEAEADRISKDGP